MVGEPGQFDSSAPTTIGGGKYVAEEDQGIVSDPVNLILPLQRPLGEANLPPKKIDKLSTKPVNQILPLKSVLGEVPPNPQEMHQYVRELPKKIQFLTMKALKRKSGTRTTRTRLLIWTLQKSSHI